MPWNDLGRVDLLITMGGNLRQFRHAAGWSMEELGRRAHVSRGTIDRIENGISLPRLDSFYRLCLALSVGPETLAGSPEDYERESK